MLAAFVGVFVCLIMTFKSRMSFKLLATVASYELLAMFAVFGALMFYSYATSRPTTADLAMMTARHAARSVYMFRVLSVLPPENWVSGQALLGAACIVCYWTVNRMLGTVNYERV